MSKTYRVNVQCYAKKLATGHYVAICLDLNLVAESGSMLSAMAKLDLMNERYVREAFGIDMDYVRDLVPRPAPLSFKIEYHWLKLLKKFYKRLEFEAYYHSFSMLQRDK